MIAVAVSRQYQLRGLLPVAKLAGLPVARIWQVLPPDLDQIEPHAASAFLTASWDDAVALARWGKPVARYVHGAGQSYVDAPRFSREYVSLFLCLTADMAERMSSTRSVVVGYTLLEGLDLQVMPSTVGITWHWDCTVSPEAGSAWREYADEIPVLVDALRREGFQVFGHAHPLAEHVVRPWWNAMGVPWVDYETLLRCETLLVDNSTAGCEAMWLGRRVVWLSSPRWRRHVWHGRRFWDWPCHSLEVRRPRDLGEVLDMLQEPWDPGPARASAVRALGEIEGATQRIVDVLHEWEDAGWC